MEGRLSYFNPENFVEASEATMERVRQQGKLIMGVDPAGQDGDDEVTVTAWYYRGILYIDKVEVRERRMK